MGGGSNCRELNVNNVVPADGAFADDDVAGRSRRWSVRSTATGMHRDED